ncbi:MAG: mechanosensitive ion channel family protein [Saprospiraceae bacterium]
MEFSTEELRMLGITAICLVGGLALGWLVERIVIGRLKRWKSEEQLEGLKIYKRLGVFTGLWVGVWFFLQQEFLSEYWHHQAFLGFKLVGIFIGTVYLARVLGRLTQNNTTELARALPSVSLLQYIVKGAVYICGILIILNELDISIAPMLTALGVGGLAVALALQDTLGNLFAGIQVVASRKLQPGHYIQLDSGQEGYIIDVTWRNMTIQTMGKTTIIIPNKTIANSIVSNTWLPDSEVSVRVEGGVHYKSDLEEVERILYDTAKKVSATVEGAVVHHEPVIRFYAFGDSSINFRVILRAKEYEWQFLIAHEMVKAIHKRFREEGIEIPFPIRTLEFNQETLTALKSKG